MRPPDSDEIHIWKVNASFVAKNEERLLGVMSEDEISRYRSFRYEKDRLLFCGGITMLRIVLGWYLQSDPRLFHIQKAEKGKPFIRCTPPLEFNISHSEDLVLCGFSRHAIGVDVEKVVGFEDMPGTAKHSFSKAEFEKWKALPIPALKNGFYDCWTRKEAIIKAVGHGLSYPLQSFSVVFGEKVGKEVQSVPWSARDTQGLELFAFKPEEEYTAALAVYGEVNNFLFLEFGTELNGSQAL